MTTPQNWRRILVRLSGWPLMALLAITAFVLGYIGFSSHLGDERPVMDLVYLTLQLFTVESGNSAGAAPPMSLEIARFLAPATTAYALGRALLRVFRDEIERWRLRRQQGHVVVVGLGWLGLAAAEKLMQQERSVVAVSLDLGEEAAAFVRRSRVPVVIGDARNPEVLRDAGVDRANHVVILAGADETSAEIALTVKAVVHEQDESSLICLAHIGDPHLCQMLRSETLADHRMNGFRLEFFNIAEEAAGIMLDEHAAFLEDERPACIGVVGNGDIAKAIVVEATRTSVSASSEPLGIVLAGSQQMSRRLATRYPQVTHRANIDLMPVPDGPLEKDLIEKLSGCDVVFVCLDDETAAISMSLDLVERIAAVPVVVALGPWSGLAEMVATGPSTTRAIHPFLVFERVLGTGLLLAGVGEKLARAVHAAYLERRYQGSVDEDDPALADWRDLREEYRASSRAQAAHLGVKLRAIGCGLAPLSDWEAPEATLTDEEIEVLGTLEHARWVDERIEAGWRPGPRDPEAKTSPYLVPWEELVGEDSERVKDLDRLAASAIPSLLARAGYRLVRPQGAGERHIQRGGDE